MKDGDTIQILSCLKELVELKEIKDRDGKTDDYLKRQPAAWATAKRLVHQHKSFGVVAKKEEKASCPMCGWPIDSQEHHRFCYEMKGMVGF